MEAERERKITVALAGNPNVGKSTLFNALTGLRQHTGNWPGKTVGIARGTCRRDGRSIEFVDLPGTYSLEGSSEDERIAAEFIASATADCTVVVCDGSCLERTLILGLQILNRAKKVVLCVNLIDEAKSRGIQVDAVGLSKVLGVSVVLTSAGRGRGLDALLQAIRHTVENPTRSHPVWEDPICDAEGLADRFVSQSQAEQDNWRRVLDRVLVSRRHGIPIMLLLLLLIIWLTVWGANYPSMVLEGLLEKIYEFLSAVMAPLPPWLKGILLDGAYATCARVIAVMLPPMAIFFPLFTILEDVGYLPRMAFLLDGGMRRCGGCGKQALTLCMGLGCNAVGVTGCRIIDSPRERLLAILTNAMVPCNGRFPTLILLSSLFFPEGAGALMVAGCIVLGILGAMGVSGILSKTALRHEESTFLMEMPPFRKPRIGQILIRSLLDRTIRIAGRAAMVAAPAGALLWLLSGGNLLGTLAGFLDPLGSIMGMNGVILLGFILSLPANELLIPVILLVLTGAGSLQGISGDTGAMLLGAGWTWKTAICTMVFSLFHWPCATTLVTVYKETGSKGKTSAAFILPTAVGVILCAMLNLLL